MRIFTRRGNDWTDRVPAVTRAVRSLQASTATIDGEAVICNERGISDFDALRAALARRTGSPDVLLYAFDLLELDGRDLRESSWESRREALIGVLRRIDAGIRLSEHLDGDDGPAMFRHACAMGLEGIDFQAPRCALSLGALPALDQGQEPERARSDARNGVTAPVTAL